MDTIDIKELINKLNRKDREYLSKLPMDKILPKLALLFDTSRYDFGLKNNISKLLNNQYIILGKKIKKLVEEKKIKIKGFDENGKIIIIKNNN